MLRKNRQQDATVGNVLRLFSHRLEDFSGESRRSYQKAYSSLQVYLIANYSMTEVLDNAMIQNWVVENILQGLTRKTVMFYLEKISSLYTGIAGKLVGGKSIHFKEIKRNLKALPDVMDYSSYIKNISSRIESRFRNFRKDQRNSILLDSLIGLPIANEGNNKSSLKFIWGSIALKAGVLPEVVKGILGDEPPTRLHLLNLCDSREISQTEREEALKTVEKSLEGEEMQWFAMRLRPKVKYEGILDRFALLDTEIKMPELFYPMQEISRRVGRKIVFKGKPVIRDVVFFKSRKSEIYPLFTKLYDLAWCYRKPGGNPGNYASIPEKAMDDFKKALGFLTPDFEVAPFGEMEIKPGDKVVILSGEYAQNEATVLKTDNNSDNFRKIFRVSLLNANGHWDIGIDARLLKKAD